MAKTVPMIISNKAIFVLDKQTNEFKIFKMPSLNPVPNIPFYHEFAEKIAESQYYFKEFMKDIYGKKLSKLILAIIVPDDTSRLESIFINEFFVNSGACKAVAQMPMSHALSKEEKFISISKSTRNVTLEYVKNMECVVKKCYDVHTCNPKQVMSDAEVLHIDLEYNDVPIYVNNFNANMDEFLEMGELITPKVFMQKISEIDVEKI